MASFMMRTKRVRPSLPPVSRRLRAGLETVVVLVFAFLFSLGAHAGPKAPDDYSDSEIMRGFMLTVFGREGPLPQDGSAGFVNKFTDPVGVYVLDNSGIAGQAAEVSRFVALLDRTVPNLEIKMEPQPEKARLFIFLVNRANYRQVIADAVPRSPQTKFLERARCSTILWNRTTGVLDKAYVFILADRGPKIFTSCLAEELTQALGPANDNAELRWSLYNDDNDVGTFGLFDWYILATLYDGSVLAGMNAEEARSVLPGAIARARAFAPRVRPLLVLP